jgi:hypothetical protein
MNFNKQQSEKNQKDKLQNKKNEFIPSAYIGQYKSDLNDFNKINSNVRVKHERYLSKASFQCDSFTSKFDKARQLASVYTKISIVTSVLLLTLIMPNSFNSLLGKSGDLFPSDSIIYNIFKIIIIVSFSIASNLNLFTRPGIVKDIMRRKLIQLNSLLENTSSELSRLPIDIDSDRVLIIIDNALRKLDDMGYDGIDNDIDVDLEHY